VAELLAQLLRGGCTAIARPVAASGLLPRCAALALRHPNCSPLHGAVARCLRLSLSKPLGPVRLWQQLLAPHPARAAAGAASVAAAAPLDLAAEVAGIAEAAAAAPTVGKRPQNMGFALAVAQALHAAATGEALGAGSRAEGQGGGGEQQEVQQALDGGSANSEGSARPEADAEEAWEAQLAAHLAKAGAGSALPPTAWLLLRAGRRASSGGCSPHLSQGAWHEPPQLLLMPLLSSSCRSAVWLAFPRRIRSCAHTPLHPPLPLLSLQTPGCISQTAPPPSCAACWRSTRGTWGGPGRAPQPRRRPWRTTALARAKSSGDFLIFLFCWFFGRGLLPFFPCSRL
jgi:hypothetical protein